jgi:hypothetical protein
MTSLETKKNNALGVEVGVEVGVETHKRTTDLESLLSIKNATIYKDMDFLQIKTIKDDDNLSWITNRDFERLLLLRKHIEQTGKKAGFQELNEGELIIVEEETITTNKKVEISNQEIYITPEDPKDNMDLDAIIRKGAQLKAREIAMPHLVVRAIADKLEEYELPEDLQEKIEDAREAANPKFTPSEVADSILMSYRQNLA